MNRLAQSAWVACLCVLGSQAWAEGKRAGALRPFEDEVASLIDAKGLTPTEVAQRARHSSPEVRRKAAEVAAAVAATMKIEMVRVPRVEASLGYTRLSEIDLPMLAPGVVIPQYFNNYAASAQVVVPVSDYLTRIPAIVTGAKLGLETARTTEQATLVAVSAQAIEIYYEWVRAELQALVAQRSLHQMGAILNQMKALEASSRISRADVLRVESQQAATEQLGRQLRALADLRKTQLQILIGADAPSQLTIGEDIRVDIEVPPLGDYEALVARAHKQRLEIRTLETGVRAKGYQLSAERVGRLPRLAVFGKADYASPNQRIFPQTEDFRFTWAAGVQLSWTLNDFLTTGYQVDTTSAELRQLEADKQRLQDGIRLETLAALQAVQIAQSALSTSTKSLKAAEEGFRVRSELLAMERATAVEVIDAETELARARAAALNARVDLRAALAKLQHATGDDIAGYDVSQRTAVRAGEPTP